MKPSFRRKVIENSFREIELRNSTYVLMSKGISHHCRLILVTSSWYDVSAVVK